MAMPPRWFSAERCSAFGRRASGVVLLACAVVLWWSSGAGAADGACAPGEGVTVVVDFADLGGGVVVRCAPGNPGTGLEALSAAGFSVTQVQTSSAFVCRIDGRPTADTEDCVAVPPADAYWSYWWADRGESWQASQVGATASIQGDVEGWAFASGSTVPPRSAVPPAPTTTTATTTTSTTSSTTTTTTPSTTTTSTTSSTTTTSVPSPITTSTTTTSTTATSTSTSTSTTTTAPTPTSAPPITQPPVTTFAALDDEPGRGLAGPVAAAALVALVGTTAIVIGRRRPDRHEER